VSMRIRSTRLRERGILSSPGITSTLREEYAQMKLSEAGEIRSQGRSKYKQSICQETESQ
jgi:hypothetical protein